MQRHQEQNAQDQINKHLHENKLILFSSYDYKDIFQYIDQHPEITTLSLNCNQYTSEDMCELIEKLGKKDNLIDFRAIEVPGNINNSWLTLLAKNKNLKVLWITSDISGGNVNLYVEDIEKIINMPISELHLCSAKMNDASLKKLAMMPYLKKLELATGNHVGEDIDAETQRANRITIAGIEALAANENLQELIFSDGGIDLDNDKIKVLLANKNLQALSLSYVDSLDDETMKMLAASSLKKLVFNLNQSFACRQNPSLTTGSITSVGFKELAKSNSLEELHFIDCRYVTDEVIQCLSANPVLKKLVLERCNKVNDIGITTLANSSTLRELHLLGMKHVTDKHIKAFSQNHMLDSLKLCSLEKVTPKGLSELAFNQTLQILDLRVPKSVPLRTEEMALYAALAANTSLAKLVVNDSNVFSLEEKKRIDKAVAVAKRNAFDREVAEHPFFRQMDPQKRAASGVRATDTEVSFPSLKRICLFALKKQLPNQQIEKELSYRDLLDKINQYKI